MAINFLQNVNLNKTELQNAIVHPLSTAPTSPSEGQIYYDTDDNLLWVYDGTAWDAYISSVTAGSGLTGGGTEGAVTIDVGAGSGITVNANDVAITYSGPNSVILDATDGTAITLASTDKFLVVDDSDASDTVKYVNFSQLSTALGSYDWNIQGDSGGAFTIASGDLVDIAGGTKLTTVSSDVTTTTTIQINHDNTTRTDTTSNGNPTHGGTFDVIDSVTSDATGHITAVNVKTVTLPADDNTTSLPVKNSTGTTQFTSTDVTGIRFVGDGTTSVSFTPASQLVTITTADQYTGTVTGTGTTNKVSKWSSSTSLTDSIITDNGTTVTIAGNLTVEGTTTTIDSTIVAIGDNMMKYAKDNTANASDIGWYGVINDGTEKYSGMWYDASEGTTTPKFALGIATTEPAGTGTIVTTGTLVANLEGNASTATALASSQDFSISGGGITAIAQSFNGTAGVTLSASIDDNAVTNAKLANMAQSTIKGRAAAAGTGDPQDLTAAQVRTIINVADGADNYASWTILDGDTTSYPITSGDTLQIVGGGGITSNFTADDVLTISHNDTSSQASVNNTGRTYIQDVTLDDYGHVTGLVSATETVTNTDTQLATASALIDLSVMAGNSTASFTHGLASKNLIVQLYDVTSGLVVHADIDHTSNNAISVIFGRTGTQMIAQGIDDIRVVVIDAKNGLTDKTVSYS